MKPTTETMDFFQDAFDFFNRTLFHDELPQVLITVQRHRGARGYFHAEQFKVRGEKDAALDQIAMNPDSFPGRTDLEILSTFVHEMVHLWQQHLGKPSRSGYHNREWADKMEDVGLIPTTTGVIGDKRTGPKCTHVIENGGRYEVQAAAFLKKRKLPVDGVLVLTAKAPKSKIKYSCPNCELNAWAKPDVSLMCGDCEEPLEGEE